MRQRHDVRGALGGHDGRDARHGQDVAFAQQVLADEGLKRRSAEADVAGGGGEAVGRGFGGDGDDVDGGGGGEVWEGGG